MVSRAFPSQPAVLLFSNRSSLVVGAGRGLINRSTPPIWSTLREIFDSPRRESSCVLTVRLTSTSETEANNVSGQTAPRGVDARCLRRWLLVNAAQLALMGLSPRLQSLAPTESPFTCCGCYSTDTADTLLTFSPSKAIDTCRWVPPPFLRFRA